MTVATWHPAPKILDFIDGTILSLDSPMSSLDASTTEICPSVGINMSSFVDHDIDIDSAYIKINSINNDELRSSGRNSPQINLIYNISHGDNKSKSSPLIKKDNTASFS